jgi:glycerol kinase
LMTLTGSRLTSTNGLSSTIAWSRSDSIAYALEGNISVSGQAASFMAEILGVSNASALSALAESVDDSNGVAFVPALMGLGAPHWRSDARGTITGMSLGTQPAHLARAAIEAIAFQVSDVFAAMDRDIGAGLTELRADGGASQNRRLMQFQADIIGRPVAAAAAPEVSALGAAALAFAGMGVEMPAVSAATRFTPQIGAADRAARSAHWAKAVAQALTTS